MSNTNGFEMSVKDYAAQRGKTVQAVYQQMKRQENAAALEGHVVLRRIGNKNVKFLDEAAIHILDTASSATPTVIIQDDLRNELTTAQQQMDALRIEAAKREGQIELLLRQLADKDRELRQLAEPQSKIDALEAQNADLSAELDSARQTAQAASDELTEAQQRIRELEGRTWWQLLFKKKG